MKKTLGISMYAIAAPAMLMAQEDAAEPVSLTPLLMYVADYQSAEAVAPRVVALLEKTPHELIHLDEFDRNLLEMTGCFGSPQLSQALAPFIAQMPAEDMPEIAQHMALLHEMWNMMEQITLVLESVHSYEDAESAADALQGFKPFMYTWSQAVAALDEPEGDLAKRRLRMAYLVKTRPLIGKLLNTWADLALRDSQYYGSERLVEGLQDVCDVLENMGMAAEPDAMPSLASATRELMPLLNQWLGVISLVRDKDSADVAAVHIVRIHMQMSDVMRRAALSHVHEKDLFNVSPRFEIQAHVCDRIMHYLLEEVNPPCFGSERLMRALQHED